MLDVRDLAVTYGTASGTVAAVRGVDLSLAAGGTLGLVGESGCGKTSVVRALFGLLPHNARVTGSIRICGEEVVGAEEARLQRLRGGRIALVPQGAMSSLDPIMTIGAQVAESVRAHRGTSRDEAEHISHDLLSRVGLAARWPASYPHQLSGGMRQRAVIAMALAGDPDVIVADEPTTGLDVLVEARILDLFGEVTAERGLALLLVSHDLRVVLSRADRVNVLYAGRTVESRSVGSLRAAPRHPYSAGLLGAVPRIDRPGWVSIPGSAADPTDLPAGCAFAPRCSNAVEICGAVDPELAADGAGLLACHEPVDFAASYPSVERRTASVGGHDELVVFEGVSKSFTDRKGLFRTNTTPVLDGVDLRVGRAEIVGLVGASGSGKTTLARMLVGLVTPTAGTLHVDGEEIGQLRRKGLRRHRRRVALIEQDPYDALHPGMRVADLVAEPLRIAGVRGDVAEAVRVALAAVGLPLTADFRRTRPGQLSGGQQQRVALARALITDPVLLVADEPTSMLDVSTRAAIAATLTRLRDERGLAVLLITHDLAEASKVCDRICVLHEGRIIEAGPAGEVVGNPQHTHTQELLAAAVPAAAT